MSIQARIADGCLTINRNYQQHLIKSKDPVVNPDCCCLPLLLLQEDHKLIRRMRLVKLPGKPYEISSDAMSLL